MDGYPTVNELNGQNVVGTAAPSPHGYLGGSPQGAAPQPVVLTKGATASALLEGSAVSQPSGNVCGGFTALQLGPPGGQISTTVPGAFHFCSLQVHPLQAGPSGGVGS